MLDLMHWDVVSTAKLCSTSMQCNCRFSDGCVLVCIPGHYQRHQLSNILAAGRVEEDLNQSGSVSPVSTGETSAVVVAGESLRFPAMESEKGACLLRNGGRVAGRCNGSGRGEIGRKAGQIPGGQWVAVNENQRERDGETVGGMTGCHGESMDFTALVGKADLLMILSHQVVANPLANKPSQNSPPPGKEDSSTATRELVAGGKLREDLKRRRGIQEWRMKQPSSQQSSPSPTKQFSSPESIASATKPCESEDEVQSAGVLPLALQVKIPHPV